MTFKSSFMNNIYFTTAKITPIKLGQFATVYKHINHKNMPFESTDGIDFIIINIKDEQNNGKFVFDKQILIKKGIMTH